MNSRITAEVSVVRELGEPPDRFLAEVVALPGELRWIGRRADIDLGEIRVDRKSITSRTVLALAVDDGCMTVRQGRHRGPVDLRALPDSTEMAYDGLRPWEGDLDPDDPDPRFLTRDRYILSNSNALVSIPDLRADIFLRWEPTDAPASARVRSHGTGTPPVSHADLPKNSLPEMRRHTLQLMIVLDTIDRVGHALGPAERLRVIQVLHQDGDLERQQGSGPWTAEAVRETKRQGRAAITSSGYTDLWALARARHVPIGLLGSLALKTERVIRQVATVGEPPRSGGSLPKRVRTGR